MMRSLCTACQHCQRVVSGTGSQFLLCRKSLDGGDFSKYPPQPVLRCNGYEESRNSMRDARDEA